MLLITLGTYNFQFPGQQHYIVKTWGQMLTETEKREGILVGTN